MLPPKYFTGARHPFAMVHRKFFGGTFGNVSINMFILQARLFTAHARRRLLDVNEITEALLNYNPKEDKATKQLKDFHVAIHSWAKFLSDLQEIQMGSSHIHSAMEAGEKAEALLIKLEHCAEDTYSTLTPTVVTYNNVMHVWAKAAQYIGNVAAVKAEEILIKMMSKCNNLPHEKTNARNRRRAASPQPPYPTITSVNTVIDAYAKGGELDAGENAERVLKSIDTWNRKEKFLIIPNAHSFSSVIEAHAHSGRGIAAANRAQAILDEMLFFHSNKILLLNSTSCTNPIPNTTVFNSVLSAYANSGQGIVAAERAEQLLESMLQRNNDTPPTTVSFSLVIDCWAKAKQDVSPHRAEKLLRRMEDLYKEGFDTKPNKFIFTSIINTWVESNDPLCAEKADALLEKMLTLYEKTNDAEYAPSIITFNVVLKAWSSKSSKCQSSINRIFDILRQMKELSRQKVNSNSIMPDIISYNTVLSALARRGGQEAALRSLEIFAEVENSSQLEPDINTFNSVLNCLAKSGETSAHLEVSSFLNAMEERALRDETAILPDRISYTTLIDALSRSKLPNQGLQARDVLNQMFDLHRRGRSNVHPDVYTFTSVLQVFAKTKGRRNIRRDALRQAIQTFEELQRQPHVQPNSLTYETMLNAISALSSEPDERDRFFEHIFNQCSERGLLNQQLLDIFQNVAGKDLCNNLFGNLSANGNVQSTHADRSWSLDVQKEHFRKY